MALPDEGDLDRKYITFKRQDFYEMMGLLALPPWMNPKNGSYVGGDFDCAVFAEDVNHQVKMKELTDVVVIRRQDRFAGPALAAYAACMAVAISLIEDKQTRAELLLIADYFQRQSELAGDEAWKTPDL